MDIAHHFLQNYSSFKAADVEGRYFSEKELLPVLKKLDTEFSISEIGKSFLKVPIRRILVGRGSVKILAWSQMHGNETTTTKGVIDLLNFFSLCKNEESVKEMLEQFTLMIIPILNPDGAARYTRENVNNTDLNRDAQHLREPESRVLRECFEDFKPDFCFNLHDQRTIFGAGKERNPATLSFLAPSMDEERTITPVREKAMKLIVSINKALQTLIPGQIGRFDDSFNLNCAGDYFQSREVPTILFECGHFPEDYQREKTRELFAYSLIVALEAMTTKNFLKETVDDYFAIPENRKSFFDIILRNAVVKGQKVDIAFQFKEVMKAGEINFLPEVQTMAPQLGFYGHREIDAKEEVVTKMDEEELSENDVVEVILLNKEKLSIKTL